LELQQQIHKLIGRQITNWELAKVNYAGLARVEERDFQFDGFQVKAQFNPERIRSSAAHTDRHSISSRPCFLCKANRPAEQEGIDFDGKYEILINPFPIFEKHLTIVGYNHVPQVISGRIGDLLDLSMALPDFTVFYNGPKCGASAPDHFHFQAGQKGVMPVDCELNDFLAKHGESLINNSDIRIEATDTSYLRKLIRLRSEKRDELINKAEAILDLLPKTGEDEEPMLNLLASFENGQWQLLLFPRERQRPCQYFLNDENQILMSPASVEMGGLAILPRKADFEKISIDDLADIFRQVSFSDETFEQLKASIREL